MDWNFRTYSPNLVSHISRASRANWNSCACFDKAFFCIMPLTQNYEREKVCGVQSSYDIIYSSDTNHISIINIILNCALVARLVLCFIGGGSLRSSQPMAQLESRTLLWGCSPSAWSHFQTLTPAKQGRKKITRGISNAQDKQKLLERR